MKKLILLTSALTLIGGAAVAEITFGGEASVSYGNWETAPGTAAAFDFDAELTGTMEEMTSGGLTYGAEFTLDLDAGTVENGVIYVSGGFGKVSFGIDEFGELNSDVGTFDAVTGVEDDEDYGDVKYEGEFGGVSVTLVADAQMGLTPGDATIPAADPDWDLALAYAGAGFTLGLDTDSTSDYDLSASVDVGNFTIGASVDEASVVDVYASTSFGAINAKLIVEDVSGTPVYGIELDGDSGDISWAVATNTDEETTASVGYAMGDLSIGLAYDNDVAPTADRGDEADLILTIGYGMDMLDFELKFNDVEEYEISMTAGFEF